MVGLPDLSEEHQCAQASACDAVHSCLTADQTKAAPQERGLHALPLDAQRGEPGEGAVGREVCQEVVDNRRRDDPADVLRLAARV